MLLLATSMRRPRLGAAMVSQPAAQGQLCLRRDSTYRDEGTKGREKEREPSRLCRRWRHWKGAGEEGSGGKVNDVEVRLCGRKIGVGCDSAGLSSSADRSVWESERKQLPVTTFSPCPCCHRAGVSSEMRTWT